MTKNSEISFVKMQGTGNDFVVVDNRESIYSMDQLIKLSPKLCHRKYGVGADGLLALQQPRLKDTDFEMIYRNADGSDAGMCGNGSRCLALFASQLGMGERLRFNVHENIYTARVENSDAITVTFPVTSVISKIEIDHEMLWKVNTGTEHIVQEVSEKKLKNEDYLITVGQTLRYHNRFKPAGTNVNFLCGLAKDRIKLQTYERGVENLTFSCGTGAIASALVWHAIQQLTTKQNEFQVNTTGGALQVNFEFDHDKGIYKNIALKGPAKCVFKGTYHE